MAPQRRPSYIADACRRIRRGNRILVAGREDGIIRREGGEWGTAHARRSGYVYPRPRLLICVSSFLLLSHQLRRDTVTPQTNFVMYMEPCHVASSAACHWTLSCRHPADDGLRIACPADAPPHNCHGHTHGLEGGNSANSGLGRRRRRMQDGLHPEEADGRSVGRRGRAPFAD